MTHKIGVTNARRCLRRTIHDSKDKIKLFSPSTSRTKDSLSAKARTKLDGKAKMISSRARILPHKSMLHRAHNRSEHPKVNIIKQIHGKTNMSMTANTTHKAFTFTQTEVSWTLTAITLTSGGTMNLAVTTMIAIFITLQSK